MALIGCVSKNISSIKELMLFSNYTRLRYSRSATTASKLKSTPKSTITDDFDEAFENEEEILKKCNKSRLKVPEFNYIHDQPPPIDPEDSSQETLTYKRKMYALYGSESGVDPAICFPTKQEIDDIKEFEGVAYPFTIQQMRDTEIKRLEDEKRQYMERERNFAEQMKIQAEWKSKIQERIAEQLTIAKAAKDKREKLIEEVRRHFGYKVDPKEERFQLLLEEKEKEQQKVKKQEKKKKREEFFLAKIAALESSVKPKEATDQSNETDEPENIVESNK